MAPQEILDAVWHHPFEPFRLGMWDGTHHEVRSPDLCMVGTRTVIIGLTARDGDDLFERTVRLDVLHVTKIEPLPVPAPPQQGNGQAAG